MSVKVTKNGAGTKKIVIEVAGQGMEITPEEADILQVEINHALEEFRALRFVNTVPMQVSERYDS